MTVPIILFIVYQTLISISIYYIGGRKDGGKSLYLLITLFSCFLFISTYALELTSTNIDEAKRALYAQFMGYPAYVIFYFFTSLELCNIKLKKRHICIGFIYIVIILTMVLTNDIYHLYYTDFEYIINETGPNQLTYTHSFLGKINSYIVYVFMTISFLNIVVRYSLWNRTLKKRLNFYLVGAGVSFTFHILYIVGFIETSFDITYFILAFPPLCYTFGIYKHNTLDIEATAIQKSVDSMQNSILVLNSDWEFVYANKQAKAYVPHLNNIITGDSLKNIIGLPQEICEPLDVGSYKFDFATKKHYLYIQCSVNKIEENKKLLGYILTFTNLTPMKDELDKAVALSSKDPLTGALNRRSFYEILYNSNKLDKDSKLALAMIDIDNFKNINDTYGHPFGDEVLRQLVNTIHDNIGKDDLLCRYGGEEFTIYLPNTTEKNTLRTLTSVIEAVRNIKIPYEDIEVQFTISIGYKVTPNHNRFDATLEEADKALYAAKRTGKDKICHYDDIK